MPTLYIHGRESGPVHRAIGQRIADLRPGAPDLLLDQAGHAVHVQQAAQVNGAIRRFYTGDPRFTSPDPA